MTEPFFTELLNLLQWIPLLNMLFIASFLYSAITQEKKELAGPMFVMVIISAILLIITEHSFKKLETLHKTQQESLAQANKDESTNIRR